ncbi:MAG: ABC-F family ATP-binding cassette domain-containing protein [Spirochaetaceae bacterium]|jgi:ATP-binding cassette subfamily F protein 3|nr:ABC-F family ATP-binding cassette domain-containing protein [Spirochaetaceae bacterium]
MATVQFTKVSLAFGDRDILKEANLYLSAGSRSCLAGANGSGKSTLMKVIAGKIAADSGDRAVQRGSRVSYLPQSGDAAWKLVHRGMTLREEAETAYGEFAAMLTAMEDIGHTLEGTGGDDRRTAALLGEYHRLQERVENSGYYSRDQRIPQVLGGLGFSAADMDRRTEEFSGGWQMRVALAKVLLEQPDILLLDEPTNYLDIEARTWLEGWLRSFTGGYLLVSHDRYFLDVTVNEVYELFQGNLKRYTGNYTAYEKTRQVEMESLMKRYAAQREEIARTESLIRRFRYKASKAAFAQELIKRLEKMEKIEIPESLKKIRVSLPPPPHAGRTALTLEGAGKQYGSRRVLSGLDLVLESGERLLVVGRNGAGKTTLLKIIAGEDRDFEGVLRYGAGIRPGYFSQDAAEAMTGSDTVLEFMEAEAPAGLVPRIRDMLGAFLFRGDDVYKPRSVLSGGEKSRLALLRMLLKPMNLLILDEPTNHLDLYSKDILTDALKRYTGTIVFVSHDRAFMEALSTKTLELSHGQSSPGPSAGGASLSRLFYGNYAYYLDRTGGEDAADGPPPPVKEIPPQAPPDAPPGPDTPVTAEKNSGSNPPVILIKAGRERPLTAGERREQEKRKQLLVRRLKRREEEILRALENLEAEKARLEGELATPEVYRNGEKTRSAQARLAALAGEIETKTREWETTAGELAEI